MTRGEHTQGVPAVTSRFERAIRLATRGHYFQFRKRDSDQDTCHPCSPPLPASCIPYVTHLLAVATILAGIGADDRVLAAAVLHDYLEDVPDPDGAETIAREVDGETLALVQELTEDKRHHLEQEQTWEVRKEEQLAAIATMSPEALVIKAADLLHNVFSLVVDLQAAEQTETVWDRFNAGRERQLWYFESAYRAIWSRLGDQHPLVRHLGENIATVRDHC